MRSREPPVLLLHRDYLRATDGHAQQTSSEVLTREVMVTTGLAAEQSNSLLSWAVDAARELPRFFLAAATAPAAANAVLVLVAAR